MRMLTDARRNGAISILFGVAIGSAIMFDKFPEYSVTCALVGAIAGLALIIISISERSTKTDKG